ncbi:putative reverse transcriptase domain-containing protein [Tanacetum coccineum]
MKAYNNNTAFLTKQMHFERVMAASVIPISSDSSEESVGSHVSRVILFGAIPALIYLCSPSDSLFKPPHQFILTGCDASGQTHSGPSTRVASSRYGMLRLLAECILGEDEEEFKAEFTTCQRFLLIGLLSLRLLRDNWRMRDWVDSLRRHMKLSQEEFCQIRRYRDDVRRRLRRLESFVERRLGIPPTIGVDAAFAMTWRDLMKLMIEVYCPRNEIQKMETELWNLTVKNNDLAAYTQRFQELTLLCTRMVPGEEDQIFRGVRRTKESLRAIKEKTMHNYPLFKTRQNVGRSNVPEPISAPGWIISPQFPRQLIKGPRWFIKGVIHVLNVEGSDQSFVLTTFSTLLDIIPDPLMLVFVSIIEMEGCEYQLAVIVCGEKIVRIPFRDEILIIQGDRSDKGKKLTLSIISCTKTQKYIEKGCQVFLAQVTKKEIEVK